MRTAIKNCVNWSFHCTWDNRSISSPKATYAKWTRQRVKEKICCKRPACHCKNIRFELKRKLVRNFGQENKINRLKEYKWIKKISSDVIQLVEERLNDAFTASVHEAMKRSFKSSDEILKILARNHDISEAAVTLSADLARILYPELGRPIGVLPHVPIYATVAEHTASGHDLRRRLCWSSH